AQPANFAQMLLGFPVSHDIVLRPESTVPFVTTDKAKRVSEGLPDKDVRKSFRTWPSTFRLSGLPPPAQVKEPPLKIHPTATISPSATLSSDVPVGSYAIIEDGVVIGSGCSIGAHTVVKTGTIMGEGNDISEHVVLGGVPQHLKKSAELGNLVIGNNN